MKNASGELDRLREAIRQELTTISAGTTLIGNDKYPDESPTHEVFLNEFKIGRYLVTNLQYATFLNILGIENVQNGTYLYLNIFSGNVRINNLGGAYEVQRGFEKHPVTHVNWLGAYAFCIAVGGRLPTETEWEKAARGKLRDNSFPWGNKSPSPAFVNFGENVGTTSVVGSYPPNRYGLYDMSGNVWEWTMDWYHPKYYKEANYMNPTGPRDGVDKVIRGGGWAYPETDLRCSKRGKSWVRIGGTNIGFRVVVELQKQEKRLSIKQLLRELKKFK